MNIKKPLALDQPEIGKFIRELRLLTGLTQEQFAASLGVTYPTINRWENGRSKPSPMAFKLLEGMVQNLGEEGQTLLSKYWLQK
ncbi:helix-turn-helix domain-containing protein [Tolypothrix bouteillei VB521301_2]|uniref:XRE family transcriptional regulator n=1 Tax=Tolypothrix bouteillei VB521301 TaxID=1479485 RepID=A0A0C1NMF4_9CYAN